MTFTATFKVFLKVNTYATAKIENSNPEKLLQELQECGIEIPTIEKLLYHLFVTGAAYAGKNDLLITHSAGEYGGM